MQAEIHYVRDNEAEKRKRFKYETVEQEPMAALEEIFRQFNHVDGTEGIALKGYKARSMSIGDVVFFPETNAWYYCASCGWEQITQQEAEAHLRGTVGIDKAHEWVWAREAETKKQS